jgi:hypothetical protein
MMENHPQAYGLDEYCCFSMLTNEHAFGVDDAR